MNEIAGGIRRRIGRTCQPLFDVDAGDRRVREATLGTRLGRVGTALSGLTEQVERVTERLRDADVAHVKYLRDAMWVLDWSTRRQMTFQTRAHRASQHRSEHDAVRQRVVRRIAQIARRAGPVLVGPWTGEVGYELLYWTPFVRWAVDRFGIAPDRITVLSRGDTASWYGIEGARYLDALQFCSPEEFREHTVKARKQRRLRLFDRHLLREVSQVIAGRLSVLHPSMMYSLYMPYWKERASIRGVQQFARFAAIRPPVTTGLDLPGDYVALRFYFSKNFPDSPENHAFIHSLIESLTADTHVVLLGTGASLDEHSDFIVGRSDRVHTVQHAIRPETNLAVQTAVIGGAQGFIGTYGGFAYLPPLCGVNTIAVYSQRSVYAAFAYHLDFAQQLFQSVDGGTLTLMDVSTQSFMRHLAAAASPRS